ncbi:glycosyltransferase [Psychrobacter sp. FME5]|uniref:CgeB family protein n=1 Tax=Psychrobacter sp. FME5 TaxID=2487706 RepID=UPI00178811EE|nr:glycosyltransferase [Psychrobacter sp. FME5]MBE0444161.1 glycosyltransferase [Psychrobacter sp. FME5]
MLKTKHRASKKLKMPSIQLIEKLELPLQEPVWYPTAVKSGQRISIKAIVEYLNISPANKRKAVLLIRAYNEAGEEVDVSLESMFRSEAFDAHFKYLASTQGEVEELYTFIVPEGVTTIHFGFNRFLCSENEQVLISDLTIYPEVESELPKKLETANNHFIEKLELPSEEPVWYPTAVKSGQRISIKAIVEYLNISPANKRKAVLLIRAYNEAGEEVDVSLESMFRSDAFDAHFKYLASTQGEVEELYTFVVPKEVATIHFGFNRFLCSEEERILLYQINIHSKKAIHIDNRNDVSELKDELLVSYEKIYKLKDKMIYELEENLKEIESILGLNKNLKALFKSNDVITTQSKDENTKALKSTKISIPKKGKVELKDTFKQGLTLLDPISEECWNDAFQGFGVVKNNYSKQIATTKSDFAFFESAWKANKSEWLYAFTSPNLQHNNAQKLLDVFGKLREKKIPVIFWNKEDPMHYEMFKPIAKEADYVFTTDSQIVEKYRKELKNANVWSLSFAAPVSKTNPIDRFSGSVENVCFAGTYYAKNHPDRKKQMDKLLPALLDNDGFIYNRVSENKSDNYAYPSEYNEVIRDGVGFEEMIELYKKFKIFLNVNTIVSSPTMMSRRVYELLASGTPVVSTPSKAITAQFPGIVLTATNKDEANIAVGTLLDNSYFWHKQSVLGIREIMLKHTYQIRWEYIKNCIADQEVDENSLNDVSIVARYTGLIEIESFIGTLLSQKNINIDKLIIINDSKKLHNASVGNTLKSNENNKLSIVDSYNDAFYEINEANSQYVYFTEDSIINFQNAVLDLILATKYTKSKAITRQIHYDFEELKDKSVDKVNLDIDDANWYRSIEKASLRSVLIDRLSLDNYKVNSSEWEIENSTGSNDIFVIDPFNVVSVKKFKNNRLLNDKIISDFIYKYNSWLGV